MTYEKIIQDINNKVYYPIYVLSGEEDFFIDDISQQLSDKVLNETEKEFNQSILYGQDLSINALLGTVKRYPMMANYQLIIVKEAQQLKNIESLQSYIENPLKSSILVLNYKHKSLDKRKAFGKALKKSTQCVLFDSPRFKDYKIPAWITNHLKQKGFSITPDACLMIAEHLGEELSKIANELNKLSINLKAGEKITPSHVEKYIGISKDYNVFELQKAIGQRNHFRTFKIAKYFIDNEKQVYIPLIIGGLFNYFEKILLYQSISRKSPNEVASELRIHPFFLKDYQKAASNYKPIAIHKIINLLRKYDMKSKGVDNSSVSGGELLKELLVQILQ